MLNRSIREKREELRLSSVGLKESSLNSDYIKSIELRLIQEELYKKWKFYDNLIKLMEKVEK